jgi:hypothetical protein
MAEMLGSTVGLDTLGSTIFELPHFAMSLFSAGFEGLSHSGAISANFVRLCPPPSAHNVQ